MFEYKVVNVGDNFTEYRDVPLQNCWVQEILLTATTNYDTVLPPQFGFFPTVEVLLLIWPIKLTFQGLVTCQTPNVQLWSQFSYDNLDPLRQAQSGAFPELDFASNPSIYWAQAVLIYWWDQMAINLTQADTANFNSSLKAVLFEGRFLAAKS